jgi:3-methyladenine DNA glycosylase Tag
MTELRRCAWADSHRLLREYHDQEYGSHRKDDGTFFELLCLKISHR